MKNVLVLVEGQTEERFFKDVLRPYYWDREISLIPKIATTKRVMNGPHFKGGITHYAQVEKDITLLLNDNSTVAVSTFIDYYSLPNDFPGINSRPSGRPIQRVTYVESEWERQVNNPKFHAYLMLHEYEAMCFCSLEEIGKALNQPQVIANLHKRVAHFQNPEEINETPDGAPSKRILHESKAYQKTVHGPMIVKRIGLEVIRGYCQHFNGWLTWLEQL